MEIAPTHHTASPSPSSSGVRDIASSSSSSDLCNIASTLTEAARLQPDALAVILQRKHMGGGFTYRQYSFAELDRESARLARGLAAAGVVRGMRTAVMVRPGLDFFALMFGLFRLGAVPVLVDPGIGLRHLKGCLRDARPEAFIGITLAQAARVVLGWARDTLRLIVTVGPRLGWGGLTLRQVRRLGDRVNRAQSGGSQRESDLQAGRPHHNCGAGVPPANLSCGAGVSSANFAVAPTLRDETAAILFTSGSTGAPKGVVYTHGIFQDQIDCLRETYGLGLGDRDVSTFPPFALFGPGLGMTSIVPDMDPTRPGRANPRSILAAIADWQATSLFGSPALLARVGRWGADRGVRLETLRRVISAGAPAREETLRHFGAMLSPGVEIFTPYGATEALPVCSIGSAEVLGETAALTAQGAGVCVGRPVARAEVAIVALSDEPIARWSEEMRLPTGRIGEIVVKGPRVTREYFERPDATALAKIADPRDGGVWHRMGDTGYLDESGRLWFCGRKSHRVTLAGGRVLHTIPCERIFDTHPAVARTALVGVPSVGQAFQPAGGSHASEPAGDSPTRASVGDSQAGKPAPHTTALREAQRPVLCVETVRRASRGDRARLREELLALGATHEATRDVTTILFHRRFPVDIRHNAKIGREALARWAERQLR